MNIIIRQEQQSEFQLIYHLVKTAFETAMVSDGKEQDFVEQLRNSGNYIPELALIAEENNQLIGHIMLTKSQSAIVVINGKSFYWLQFRLFWSTV